MRVIGFMVCGPNEPYLEASLKEFKRLADDAVIATNNADEKTKKLIKKYGYWQYEDNREWGKAQPLIKTELLKRIGRLNPDVVLPIDADEVFDSSFTREELEKYSDLYPACHFYIVNLWNDEQHHRKALGFWNMRMFNWRPELGLEYQKKNLHCGLGPPWTYTYWANVPFMVKHYGLMTKESRAKKVARYDKYDPNAKWKDKSYYEALRTDTTGTEFNEADMKKKLEEEVMKTGNQQKKIMANQEKKFVYVRRTKDGAVFDIPEKNLSDTLKQGFTLEGNVDQFSADIAELFKEEPNVLGCPLCEFKAKTATGLKVHQKKHL